MCTHAQMPHADVHMHGAQAIVHSLSKTGAAGGSVTVGPATPDSWMGLARPTDTSQPPSLGPVLGEAEDRTWEPFVTVPRGLNWEQLMSWCSREAVAGHPLLHLLQLQACL